MELHEFLTEEERDRRDDFDAMMNDLYESEKQYFAEVKRWNSRLLKAIKSFRGKEFSDELELFIEESGGGFSKFQLVRKPSGKCQEEDSFEILKYVWVNQYRNGGHTGDDFAGEICIKLKRGLFLMFSYDC